MFGFSWFKIAGLVALMALGAFIAHKFDKGEIEHQKGLVTAEKLAHEKAVKDALVWATEKQQEYDHEALKSAAAYADLQRRLADTSRQRVYDLERVPPTVLVRGCLTYEFVRHLDAAISGRTAGALPLPAGKPNDACAPVDAVAVVRWLLGIVETAKENGAQLDGLITFFRDAQARR